MFKPKDHQARVAHRLKISRGHLTKILQMVEEDAYCIDILHQLQAVEKALKETEHTIMENHLKTCAADAIKEGKTDMAIKEVMEIFRKKD